MDMEKVIFDKRTLPGAILHINEFLLETEIDENIVIKALFRIISLSMIDSCQDYQELIDFWENCKQTSLREWRDKKGHKYANRIGIYSSEEILEMLGKFLEARMDVKNEQQRGKITSAFMTGLIGGSNGCKSLDDCRGFWEATKELAIERYKETNKC